MAEDRRWIHIGERSYCSLSYRELHSNLASNILREKSKKNMKKMKLVKKNRFGYHWGSCSRLLRYAGVGDWLTANGWWDDNQARCWVTEVASGGARIALIEYSLSAVENGTLEYRIHPSTVTPVTTTNYSLSRSKIRSEENGVWSSNTLSTVVSWFLALRCRKCTVEELLLFT